MRFSGGVATCPKPSDELTEKISQAVRPRQRSDPPIGGRAERGADMHPVGCSSRSIISAVWW